MTLEEALAVVAGQRLGVLVTLRRNGRPQTSNVACEPAGSMLAVQDTMPSGRDHMEVAGTVHRALHLDGHRQCVAELVQAAEQLEVPQRDGLMTLFAGERGSERHDLADVVALLRGHRAGEQDTQAPAEQRHGTLMLLGLRRQRVLCPQAEDDAGHWPRDTAKPGPQLATFVLPQHP